MTGPDTIFSHLSEAIKLGDLEKLERYLNHPRCPNYSKLGNDLWNIALEGCCPQSSPHQSNLVILERIQKQFPIKFRKIESHSFETFFKQTNNQSAQIWMIDQITNHTESVNGIVAFFQGLINLGELNEQQKKWTEEIWQELNNQIEKSAGNDKDFTIYFHTSYFFAQTIKIQKLNSPSSPNVLPWGCLFLLKQDIFNKWAIITPFLNEWKLESSILALTQIKEQGIEIDWDAMTETVSEDLLFELKSILEKKYLEKTLIHSINPSKLGRAHI